jgi:hypothetical protein
MHVHPSVQSYVQEARWQLVFGLPRLPKDGEAAFWPWLQALAVHELREVDPCKEEVEALAQELLYLERTAADMAWEERGITDEDIEEALRHEAERRKAGAARRAAARAAWKQQMLVEQAARERASVEAAALLAELFPGEFD